MLPEVPSIQVEAVEEDGAAALPSAAPPAEVRTMTEVMAEQLMAAPIVPPAEPSRAQSSFDFAAFSSTELPTGDREKAPATSADDGSSASHLILFDIRVSEGESVLANLALARRLI